MIEKQISYKIEFTEQQARQLYQLLIDAKDSANLKFDGRMPELRPIYEELKKLFDSGVR
jgi:hypothetical protein